MSVDQQTVAEFKILLIAEARAIADEEELLPDLAEAFEMVRSIRRTGEDLKRDREGE